MRAVCEIAPVCFLICSTYYTSLQINNMCSHIAYVLALYAISGLIPGLISRILSARLKNMIKRREQAFVGMTLK